LSVNGATNAEGNSKDIAEEGIDPTVVEAKDCWLIIGFRMN
jgi:hypothetical protein